MLLHRALSIVVPICLLALGLNAHDALTDDELKMLQDPGGWEYITISDPDNGVQTKHTCFDGQPHPDECSGTLTLNPDNTFTQKVHIHGQTVERHGTYQLDGKDITFTDELSTSDGPYTLDLNAQSKQMSIQMAQAAGVLVRVDLQLEKEYKKQLQSTKGN